MLLLLLLLLRLCDVQLGSVTGIHREYTCATAVFAWEGAECRAAWKRQETSGSSESDRVINLTGRDRREGIVILKLLFLLLVTEGS